MTCPTITALHAILAAYDAPAGPSKADTLKAVAECLSGACAPATCYIGSEANAELIERGAVLCAVTAKPVSRDDVPLYSQPVATQGERDALIAALTKIARWELPETGEHWNDGTPMSYGGAFGSNGERDYMKKIASNAILAAKGGAQ